MAPDVRVVGDIGYVNHRIVHYRIDGVDVLVKQSYPRSFLSFSCAPSAVVLVAGAEPTSEDRTRFQDILSANFPLTDWGWSDGRESKA